MANTPRFVQAYTLDALTNLPPKPIEAKRAPTTHDTGYPLGSLWIFKASNLAYILTSIVNNIATWLLVQSGGGSGVFASLTVTPGPISLTGTTTINTSGAASTTIGTGGTGAVNIGNATGGTAITGVATVSGNITSTTGDILASSGNVTAGVDVIAEAGVVEGVSLIATGDIAATGSDVGVTSTVVAVSGGTGVFAITSTSGAGAGTNAGFLKLYLGATAIYVPYYTATT